VDEHEQFMLLAREHCGSSKNKSQTSVDVL